MIRSMSAQLRYEDTQKEGRTNVLTSAVCSHAFEAKQLPGTTNQPLISW